MATQGEANTEHHNRLSRLERFMKAVLMDAPKHVIDYVDGKTDVLPKENSKEGDDD